MQAHAANTPPAGAPHVLDLHASVVTHPATFKKYLYSFPLPGKVAFEGLSGSVSTNQSLPDFSEALISLHDMPSGRCPQNGEVYDTYEQIAKKNPGNRDLANFIVKNAKGASRACRRSSRCRQACRSRTARWSSSMAPSSPAAHSR
jgi:hypothetical protein